MSRTYRNPADFARAMEARLKATSTTAEHAHDEIVKGAVQDYAELTSGRVPQKEIAGAFARNGARSLKARKLSKFAQAHGNSIRKGVLQPLPINKQTGKLRRSFVKEGPYGKGRRVLLSFQAPYAGFVLAERGTRTMKARGFQEEIRKRHKARLSGAQRAIRAQFLK